MCLIHWRGITRHCFQLNTEIFVCVLAVHVPNNGIWGPEKWKFLNMIPLSTVKTEASSWARILHVQSMTADAWSFFTKSHCQLLAWHACHFLSFSLDPSERGLTRLLSLCKTFLKSEGKTFNFLVHVNVNIPKQNQYSQESSYTASAVHFLFTWNEPNPNTLVAL